MEGKIIVAYSDEKSNVVKQESIELDKINNTLLVKVGSESKPASIQDINKVEKIFNKALTEKRRVIIVPHNVSVEVISVKDEAEN